ncbi:MAG: hypothetical protein ABI277_03265 [Burkholderiaceae bacterium]
MSTAIRTKVSRFSDVLSVDERWEIFWAAGVGTMGNAERDLSIETLALGALLDAIGRGAARHEQGCFFLGSSAGAINVGSADPVISEALSNDRRSRASRRCTASGSPTSLFVGISQLLAAERMRYVLAGRGSGSSG